MSFLRPAATPTRGRDAEAARLRVAAFSAERHANRIRLRALQAPGQWTLALEIADGVALRAWDALDQYVQVAA